MIIKNLLVLCLALKISLGSSQSFSKSYNTTGTLITNFELTDGILTFIESRETVTGQVNGTNRNIFYFDNFCKSIILGNNIVSVGGTSFINDTSVIYFLSQIPNVNCSAFDLLFKIYDYFESKFPPDKYGFVYTDIIFYVTGLNIELGLGNEIVEFYPINASLKIGAPQSNWMCSPNNQISREIKEKIINSDHITAIGLLTLEFERIGKIDSLIGGPNIIYFIPYETGVPRCLKGCNSDLEFITIEDIFRSYKKGKILINPIRPFDFDSIDYWIRNRN